MSTATLRKSRRHGFGVGKAVIYLVLGLFALTIVIAFWHLLNLSLSPSYIATKGGLLLYPKDEPFHIRKILREPHFTFEHKEVGTLLMEMQEGGISLIIVLDEYGSTSGMITMEDILEEIVGEIRDEYDKDETDAIIELKPGREYLIDGSTNLTDVNDTLKIDLESEEYDSIGGYIIEKLDRLPKSGETILLDNGIKLITELVKRNRIEKVHVFIPEESEDASEK